MKIAHVVSTFPPHIGGMGMVTYEEAQRLQKRGHEVTVFTLQYPHTTYHTIDQSFPFNIVRLSPWFRAGDGGLTPQLFARLKNFDIIHLHYPFYGGAEWVWRAARWYKKPYVVTYHMDADPTGSIKKALQTLYDRWWALKILCGARVLIGVGRQHFLSTKFGKKLLEQRKCVEIKLGIDTEIFKTLTVFPQNFSLPSGIQNKKIILFVGNLITLKRLEILIEAFKTISFTESEAVVVIVGDGSERSRYEKLTHELGLSEKIFFVGVCSDKQILSAYYNSATVVVVPSEQESFSLVTSEAMACGKVVIGSSIPVLQERIQDGQNGFLFQEGNAEDLERVLMRVLQLSADEQQRIGEYAQKKIIKNYSWEKHVDELEEVYNSVRNFPSLPRRG